MTEPCAQELEEQLEAVSKQYCRLLHDLAALKLQEGKTQEAERLFGHLAVLQQVRLSETAQAVQQQEDEGPVETQSSSVDAQSTSASQPSNPASESRQSGAASTGQRRGSQDTAAAAANSAAPAPAAADASEGSNAALEEPQQQQSSQSGHEGTTQELKPAFSEDWENDDLDNLPAPSGMSKGGPQQQPPQPSLATLHAASQPLPSEDWGTLPPAASGPSASASSTQGAATTSGSSMAFGNTSGGRPLRAASSATQLRSTSASDDVFGIGVVWEGGYDHCVEVYNLTTDVKTGHLQSFLDDVLPGVRLQPIIRWADDSHAVLVCPDNTTAQLLLECGEECGYQVRPFSHASQQSKLLPVSELLPPKARPKTTAAVAKRLLSHALGMPGLRDRQGEQQLADARRAAREQRAALRQAAASAWGDDGEQ